MVESTKKRRRGSDTGDPGFSDHGPSKRARARSQPPEYYLTPADRSPADPPQDQVVQFFDDVPASATVPLSQMNVENVQGYSAKVSAKAQTDSLCRSSSTGSEDNALPNPDLQPDNRSSNAMLESNRELPNSGDLKELTEDDQRVHHGPGFERQRRAKVTNTVTQEIPDSKEHTQLGYPTPPAYNEKYGEGTTQCVDPVHTPHASAPQEDVAVVSRCCEQYNVLAPHVPLSTAPFTPKEYEYEHVDENFGRDVRTAYEASVLRDAYRQHKYGQEIANTWKRGSTPEDAREKWKTRAERNKAEAEQYSDSE